MRGISREAAQLAASRVELSCIEFQLILKTFGGTISSCQARRVPLLHFTLISYQLQLLNFVLNLLLQVSIICNAVGVNTSSHKSTYKTRFDKCINIKIILNNSEGRTLLNQYYSPERTNIQ
jgi:hypothetical protein